MAERAENLAGRGEELAFVERSLEELGHQRSGPRAMELLGEPGIGKTRLLAELRVRARARRCLVLSGRASEFERDMPFGLFVDALDEYVGGLHAAHAERLGEELGGELGRLLPSLAGFAGKAGAGLQHERYRAHRAVCELFERLAAAAPLVVLLDDVHWADPASVELIGALLRRPPRAPVLMALALRPRQAPRGLSTPLEDARRAGVLERLELRTLSEDEARAMVRVDEQLAKTLYEQSGGNPFYLEQLARLAERTGSVANGRASDDAVARIEAVPAAVAEALAQELELLSAPARGLLDGAAIAGDPFAPELAGTVASLAPPDALAALDELVEQDLVRGTDVPRRFRFRHPLVHAAVYEASPVGWRLAAHERASRSLEALGASANARAHHVEQFARPGDRAAIALLRQAGDAAAQRAPDNAARWYRACLRLLPEHGANARERIDLLEALAGALAATGQLLESRSRLLELLELLPANDVAARVRITIAIADAEDRLGHHAQAHARLVEALERLRWTGGWRVASKTPDEATPEVAALLMQLTEDAFYRRDFRAMPDWGVRALAATQLLDDPPLIAAATAVLAFAAGLSGRVAEADSYRARAAALVDGLDDEQLAKRLDAIVYLMAAEIGLDRYRDGLLHGERGIAVARATGQEKLFPLMIQSRALGLLSLGQLEEAADVVDGATEAARLSSDEQSLCWSLLNRSWVAILAGDFETALRVGEESVETAGRLDDSVFMSLGSAVYGWAQLEAGDPAACVELIPAAAGGPELPLLPAQFKALFQEVLAGAWLALGRADEAEHAVRHAETAAEELGLGLSTVVARRARATAMLAAEQPAAAAELALDSAAAAERIAARVEAARSRTLAGQALAAAGDRARGIDELQRAAAELDACGAIRYRETAARALRSLGTRFERRPLPASADRGASAPLTPREHEVAALVEHGKTNREIAAQLFLSEKTVETHLHHAFQKLGVSSRTSLAHELRAMGSEQG